MRRLLGIAALVGAAVMSSCCSGVGSLPPAAPDEAPAFIEREPVQEAPPDAAPHLFTPILDAAVVEGGGGWVPRDKTWGPGSVIRVCFLNGSPQLNSYVVGHARAWNEVGADVRLDFGSAANPRVCTPGSVEPIRVAYNSSNSNQSDLGRDSLIGGTDRFSPPWWNEPSMHLDVNDIRDPVVGRGLVIHEFGHALGLLHEHQKPIDGGCEVEYDWARVYATTAQMGWGRPQTDGNLRPIRYYEGLTMTEGIDSESVMIYSLPRSNYIRGERSHCYQYPTASEISAGDAILLRYVYGEESWSARGLALSSAARGAVAADQPGVARALVLYGLPLERLSGLSEAYSGELAFGFGPSGKSARQTLDEELDAALAQMMQP